MSRLLAAIFALTLLISAHSASAVTAVPQSFADLVDKLSPAVVNVYTTQKIKRQGMPQGFGFRFNGPTGPEMDPFREFMEQFNQQMGKGKEEEVTSLGSGFIIDGAGYIVTNNHVVGEADDISVRLPDDTKLAAKLIGRDSKTDLALLKVESKKPLPFVSFGNSDEVRVGDWVIAIGNPFGLGGTVTAGIISARARHIGEGAYDDFFQTDAAINRGNSGGPMFNMKGEVIGISAAIFSPNGGSVGIGFGIPSNLAQSVITQLKAHGKIARGWLGVKIQTVTDEIGDSLGQKEPRGALIMEVTKGSPAAKAGIKAGDVITSFDGKPIKAMRELPRLVAETPIGKKADVELLRGGAVKHVTVDLGELKDEDEASAAPGKKKPGEKTPSGTAVLGLTLTPLNDALREQLSLEDKTEGVVVTEVDGDSEAASRGINPGDLVVRAGDKDVRSVKDVQDAVAAAKAAGRKFVLLQIMRDGELAFVTLPLN